MARITPLSWQRLSRMFEHDGWRLAKTKGAHLVYTKTGFERPVVIPKDSRVEIFIILNNLKTARISREHYFELLKKA